MTAMNITQSSFRSSVSNRSVEKTLRDVMDEGRHAAMEASYSSSRGFQADPSATGGFSPVRSPKRFA